MSKSKAQTEQVKFPTLDDLQGWVDKARLLSSNLEPAPTIQFKYGGGYQFEDVPTTFNKVVDVEYSMMSNTITFIVSE